MNKSTALRRLRSHATEIPLTHLTEIAEEHFNVYGANSQVAAVRYLLGITKILKGYHKSRLQDQVPDLYREMTALEARDGICVVKGSHALIFHGLTADQIHAIHEMVGKRSSWRAYLRFIDRSPELDQLEASLRRTLAIFLTSPLSDQEDMWEKTRADPAEAAPPV